MGQFSISDALLVVNQEQAFGEFQSLLFGTRMTHGFQPRGFAPISFYSIILSDFSTTLCLPITIGDEGDPPAHNHVCISALCSFALHWLNPFPLRMT